MRRYDIVSGILLILSIIDFALAAPVLVQEKCQACVDVVHAPKDVITVLGKRAPEKDLLEELLKILKSSDAHASSSSAPPGPEPDHGPTNVVQAPVPGPASSIADPGLSMESSTSSVQGVGGDHMSQGGLGWSHESDDVPSGPSEYGSDHEMTGPHAPQPNSYLGLSTHSYNFWAEVVKDAGLDLPWPKGFRAPVQQPDAGASAGSDVGWDFWTNHDKTIGFSEQQPRPALPKEFGQAPENQAEHVQQPNAGPSKEPEHEAVTPPSDPEHQSSSSQPVDPQAIYAAEGNAKVTDTAGDDVGNAGKRELPPAERSLDPGDLTPRDPGKF